MRLQGLFQNLIL